MKDRTTIIGIILLAVVILVAIFIPQKDLDTKKIALNTFSCSQDSRDEEEGNLTKASCSDYQKLIQEEKDNLILIARPTCGYCVEYIPVLEEIASEYGIEIHYFNTDNLSADESKSFYASSSLYSSNQFGTPTLVISNNKEIQEYSIGFKEKDATVTWLKDQGIIVE